MFVLGPPLPVGLFGLAVQPDPYNNFRCSSIFTHAMKCAVPGGLDTRFASVLPLLPAAPSVDVKASQTPPCWGSFLAQGSLELGSRRSVPSLGCCAAFPSLAGPLHPWPGLAVASLLLSRRVVAPGAAFVSWSRESRTCVLSGIPWPFEH